MGKHLSADVASAKDQGRDTDEGGSRGTENNQVARADIVIHNFRSVTRECPAPARHRRILMSVDRMNRILQDDLKESDVSYHVTPVNPVCSGRDRQRRRAGRRKTPDSIGHAGLPDPDVLIRPGRGRTTIAFWPKIRGAYAARLAWGIEHPGRVGIALRSEVKRTCHCLAALGQAVPDPVPPLSDELASTGSLNSAMLSKLSRWIASQKLVASYFVLSDVAAVSCSSLRSPSKSDFEARNRLCSLLSNEAIVL